MGKRENLNHDEITQTVSMRKYIIAYIALYSILAVLVVIIILALKNKTAGYFGVALAFVSSYYAAQRFFDDTSRRPTSREAGVFSGYALLFSTLCSVLLALLSLAIKSIEKNIDFLFVLKMGWQTQRETFLILLLIIVIVNYVVIRCSFSWSARSLYKQHIKNSMKRL